MTSTVENFAGVHDWPALMDFARQNMAAYAAAQPFAHAVLEDLLEPAALEAALQEFPGVEAEGWIRFQNDYEVKLGLGAAKESFLGPATRALIARLNAPAFLEFLETLTGIRGLIPDPYLFGGGLHQIVPGGYLKIHTDFPVHPKLGLKRRLNLLLYLNKDWKEEYGGHLELWDQTKTRCEKKILPLFNRCVIFTTSEFSFHGHPDALSCPPGMTRKSLALYYYQVPHYAGEVSPSTSWTSVQAAKNEQSQTPFSKWLGELMPPIVWKWRDSLRSRKT